MKLLDLCARGRASRFERVCQLGSRRLGALRGLGSSLFDGVFNGARVLELEPRILGLRFGGRTRGLLRQRIVRFVTMELAP